MSCFYLSWVEIGLLSMLLLFLCRLYICLHEAKEQSSVNNHTIYGDYQWLMTNILIDSSIFMYAGCSPTDFSQITNNCAKPLVHSHCLNLHPQEICTQKHAPTLAKSLKCSLSHLHPSFAFIFCTCSSSLVIQLKGQRSLSWEDYQHAVIDEFPHMVAGCVLGTDECHWMFKKRPSWFTVNKMAL